MTQPELARKLHADGFGYKRIGKMLGVSRDKARAWCNPKRNRGAPSRRRYKYRFRCTICCNPMTSEIEGVCQGCRRADAAKRRQCITDLLREGKSSQAIADAVGTTRGSVSVDIYRLRRQGVDLPYRPTYPRHGP